VQKRFENRFCNKKPGIERRVSPSITFHAEGDGFARSSISFYPVFVTNLTSMITRQIAGKSEAKQ